ncbi:MAG: FkbM family methyltransferase [Pseudomonadota bacterium]
MMAALPIEDRPKKFARALPAGAPSLGERIERVLKGRAPAALSAMGRGEIDESPVGSLAPGAVHKAIIGLARAAPVFRSAARARAALLLMRLDPRPVDTDWYGLTLRHYPLMTSSYRLMLLAGRRYQAEEFAFLAEHAGEGPFLDIGANAGAYTFWAAAEWPGREILAFEPDDLLASALRQNIAATGASARLFSYALGDRDGAEDYSPGQESFLAGRDTVEKPVRRLLPVLTRKGITQIGALKIDVEGYEDRVLMPFLAEAPAEMLPAAILIEHLAAPLWRDDVLDALLRVGYRTAFKNAHNSGLVLTRD